MKRSTVYILVCVGLVMMLLVGTIVLAYYYGRPTHPHPTPGKVKFSDSNECQTNCDQEYKKCVSSYPSGGSSCYNLCGNMYQICLGVCNQPQ